MNYGTVQRRVYEILEVAHDGDRASRIFDIFICVLIIANVAAIVLESIPSVSVRFSLGLWLFEAASVLVFTVEYALRIWSCTVAERYSVEWM